MQRRYEAMYILDADTPEEALEPIVDKYRKVVVDGGGEVVEAGRWERGRRPLAYSISKRREGLYILMRFLAGPEVPKELDRIFRINDEIMRHLIVRQDTEVKLPAALNTVSPPGEPIRLPETQPGPGSEAPPVGPQDAAPESPALEEAAPGSQDALPDAASAEAPAEPAAAGADEEAAAGPDQQAAEADAEE